MIFEVNNNRKIIIEQIQDETVILETVNSSGEIERKEAINAGDFIMLLNMYRYIKDNDIKNSFINPYGTTTEEL